MSGTELIMGMGEVINYLKDLEAENKKLKETIEAKEAGLEQYKQPDFLMTDGSCPWTYLKEMCDGGALPKEVFNLLKEENNKLKEYQPKGSQIDPEGLHDYMKEIIDKLKEENKELKENQLTEENAIQYVYENTSGYDDWIKGSDIYQELKEENKKLKEENECVKRQIESVCKVNDELKEKLANRRWKSFEDSESEEEEKEYAVEINVVGVGWCQYENEEERDRKVVYCKNGCWKIRGDKTAKDEEGNYCETDEEE